MNLINNFKELPKGYKRLLVFGSIIVPILSASIFCEYEEEWLGYLAISIIGYWILIFFGIWIYEGFKSDKK